MKTRVSKRLSTHRKDSMFNSTVAVVVSLFLSLSLEKKKVFCCLERKVTAGDLRLMCSLHYPRRFHFDPLKENATSCFEDATLHGLYMTIVVG
jgi:hypothetical protein